MYEGVYVFAGVVIKIRSFYETVQLLCSGYSSDRKPELLIDLTYQDIEHERIKSNKNGKTNTTCGNYGNAYLETLAVYRKLAEALIPYNIILMHGSALMIDGKGIVFLGSSGIGKSTQSRLWRETFGNRVRMINDDKPLVGITGENAVVFGTPWDGKHHLSSNSSAVIKAICFIERADHNLINRIDSGAAFFQLIGHTHRVNDPELLRKEMKLLDNMSAIVDFYRLECNIEKEAAIAAYQKIFEERT